MNNIKGYNIKGYQNAYCAQKHTDLFVQVMVSQRQLDRFSHLLLLYIHAADIRIRHVWLLVSTGRMARTPSEYQKEQRRNTNAQAKRKTFLLQYANRFAHTSA